MALLVNEQLQQTRKWKLEYGEKTLVLTQVGSFYESYALKDATTGLIYGSNIPERLLKMQAEDIIIKGWVVDVAEV